MTAPLREEISIARECLAKLVRLSEATLAEVLTLDDREPWERPDIYAGATLAASRELAVGVLAEAAANCVQNAGRLSRHLFEFEIQARWILAEPATRLRMLYAEEARSSFERSEGSEAIVVALGHGHAIEPLKELLRKERQRLGRSDDARVMPGFKTMATDIGMGDDYERGYPVMSWTSHPGLSAAGRHVKTEGDQVFFAALPTEVPPFFYTGPYCQASSSLGRLIELVDAVLGRETLEEVHRVRALAKQTCAHTDDLFTRAVEGR